MVGPKVLGAIPSPISLRRHQDRRMNGLEASTSNSIHSLEN